MDYMETDRTLVAAAVAAIKGADVVVLSLGLGNDIEGEGRDRSLLTFPQPQVGLLAAVQKAIKEQNNQNQQQRAREEEKGAVAADTTGAFPYNP